MIAALSQYSRIKGHEIVIVFDGWKSGGHRETVVKTGGIKIIYSRLGEKADAVIKKAIAGGRKEWIVVTSDRDIASSAWASGSVPVPSDIFLTALESAGRTAAGDYNRLEEDDFSGAGKGNPRMLSKKQKALKRVLNKL